MNQQQTDLGHRMLHDLSSLLDISLAIDLDVSDAPGSLAVAAVSAPSILHTLRSALTLLVRIEEHYEKLEVGENEVEDGNPLSLDDIGALICSEVAAQEVRDLAFIARTQLRKVSERLATAVHAQELLPMVTCSDGALCRLRRVLIPLEEAMADFEGVEHSYRQWTDLEQSLRIRRLYARLRRDVAAVTKPALHELPELIEEFARRLAELRLDPLYNSLRVTDRIELLALGKRFSAWLASSRENLQAARTLWADFTTFVALLIQINNRQELVEHDSQLLARAYHRLYANVRPPSFIPEELLAELKAMEGRDEELDRLLLTSDSRRVEDWEEVLTRLWRNAELAGPDVGVATV